MLIDCWVHFVRLNRNVVSHDCRGWKSRIKVSAGSIPCGKNLLKPLSQLLVACWQSLVL